MYDIFYLDLPIQITNTNQPFIDIGKYTNRPNGILLACLDVPET